MKDKYVIEIISDKRAIVFVFCKSVSQFVREFSELMSQIKHELRVKGFQGDVYFDKSLAVGMKDPDRIVKIQLNHKKWCWKGQRNIADLYRHRWLWHKQTQFYKGNRELVAQSEVSIGDKLMLLHGMSH